MPWTMAIRVCPTEDSVDLSYTRVVAVAVGRLRHCSSVLNSIIQPGAQSQAGIEVQVHTVEVLTVVHSQGGLRESSNYKFNYL